MSRNLASRNLASRNRASRNRASRRHSRGQAVLETAICSIVFVTILIFLIHFAEVGSLSMKATEAAHSAMLDATGRRMHNWETGDVSPASNAATQAGKDAQTRYMDFDSRTIPRFSPLKVFTAAINLKVQCAPGEAPGWGPSDLNSSSYRQNRGINCSSEATLAGINIPIFFLDFEPGGFFNRAHYIPKPIRVCGLGRYKSGCNGKLTMMLDDWGLAGQREGKNCVLRQNSPGCDNRAFYRVAKGPFQKTTGLLPPLGYIAASTYVMPPLPLSPLAENTFWLSAVGEEKTFLQKLTAEGSPIWPTSPGLVPGPLGGIPYTVSYLMRGPCFLGSYCF